MTRDASAQTPTGRGLLAAGRALLERQLRLVRRMAEKGLEIAQGFADAAKAAGSDLERLSAAFERASRAVVMAVILETRLAGELDNPAGGSAGPEAAAREESAPRDVRGMPGAGSHDPATRERLGRAVSNEAVLNRLWRYVMTSRVEQVIARIRRDLGLSADWMREAEEDAKRESPSSPVSTGEVSPQATEGASHAHGPRPPPVLRTTSPARGLGMHTSRRGR